MNIEILELIEGSRKAKGLTVVIDVFRAFSVACYAYGSGAELVIPVGDIEIAYRLKRENPDYVLVGERGGIMPEGFDCGNSPTHLMELPIRGKTIIHTTSAGTQGLVNAREADEVLTGAFVNADAIVRYIRGRNPQRVSLVAMGWGGKQSADEDRLFAEYIRNELLGLPNDFDAVKTYLATESKTGNFLDVKDESSAPRSDFELCLSLDRFPFVLSAAKRSDGLLELRKVEVGGENG